MSGLIDISADGETLETCAGVLQEVFGYDAFRGPQADIVRHVSEGGDALVLMPTGGGKSLCYQVPAIVRERGGHGLTVVVSPLIALMHDQVGALLLCSKRAWPRPVSIPASAARRRRPSKSRCCAAS